MATTIHLTTPNHTITITSTFVGWWVARDGSTLHVHPFTTEGAALGYAHQLTR
jgi:hypothetical protein